MKNVLLAIASIAFVFLTSELVIRTRPSLQLGFDYKDGLFLPPKEFIRDARVNALGYHDVDHERNTGLFRILLLGDSYVAGNSVSVEEIVGQRLQTHIRRLGKEVEVVSLGQDGWGQADQLNELKTVGSQLGPDLVITLFVGFNDVRNNAPALQARAMLQRSQLVRFRPGHWQPIPASEVPNLWLGSSALNRFISFRLTTRRMLEQSDFIPVDYEVYATSYNDKWQDAWQLTEQLISETLAECHRMGADYFIVLSSTPHGIHPPDQALNILKKTYPAMADRDWDLEKPASMISEFCKQKDIPVLNLQPVFRSLRADGEALHWRYDGHWNPQGHDRAGKYIAAFLMDHLSLESLERTDR